MNFKPIDISSDIYIFKKKSLMGCNSSKFNSAHDAVRFNKPDVLRSIIKSWPRLMLGETSEQFTPAHLAVYLDRPECLKVMKEEGFNLQRKNSRGQTPVSLTAKLHRPNCLEYLYS